jgi:hypothetical protein
LIPIGVKPVDRQVNRADHEATRDGERQNKHRDVALTGIFNHANRFLPANKTLMGGFGSE